MENWQKQYEQKLAENYTCKTTKLPCSNCAKYGCEHMEKKDNLAK